MGRGPVRERDGRASYHRSTTPSTGRISCALVGRYATTSSEKASRFILSTLGWREHRRLNLRSIIVVAGLVDVDLGLLGHRRLLYEPTATTTCDARTPDPLL